MTLLVYLSHVNKVKMLRTQLFPSVETVESKLNRKATQKCWGV